MIKLTNSLTTNKYTNVYHENKEVMTNGAPHNFVVLDNNSNDIAEIHFQEGPIKEAGINGVANEDLLAMVLTRLEHFQETQFKCRENAVAITKLQETLMWLRKRTTDRELKGIEGTHKV